MRAGRKAGSLSHTNFQPTSTPARPVDSNTGYSSGMVAAAGRSSEKTLPRPLASVSVPATLTNLHLSGHSKVIGGGGEGVERGRVRQLEHEVCLLEQQLAEKTQASLGHVEEITCMRSELARERAALARVSHTDTHKL